MSRYECVADQKAAGFPVTKACEVVEVSTSGFYDWCAREAAVPTEREIVEGALVALMREIFDAADGNYGVPRMHRALRQGGVVVNDKRVRRLMRLHGMAGRCIRRRVRTTFPGPDGYTIPDLVGRVATCFDNAVAESFWASLKRECIRGRVFATRAEARRAIFKWITWYNSKRLHSSLDHTPPATWEQQYRQAS